MHENLKDNKVHLISNDSYFEEVQRMLAEGKDVRIRIKGNSMRPFIQSGDTTLLKAYHQGEPLALGCIVLAKDSNRYILHRLVKKKKEALVLAGDGNLTLCENVERADIIAIASISYKQDNSTGRPIDSIGMRIKGLCWYHTRLLRRIFFKLKKIFTDKA